MSRTTAAQPVAGAPTGAARGVIKGVAAEHCSQAADLRAGFEWATHAWGTTFWAAVSDELDRIAGSAEQQTSTSSKGQQ